MDWFGWQHQRIRRLKASFGPQSLLQDLDKRVPRYLDDVDQGRLIYPACKRTAANTEGDIRSIWDHTRLEAMRYLMEVPRREFELLGEPARQVEMLDTYLRRLPHEDIVIEFTGTAMADLAIAIVAGFNWLNHCATLVEVNREEIFGNALLLLGRSGARAAMVGEEGADARYGQMLGEQRTPPLMLYLVWLEYTRLAKEIASAASFGSSTDRAIEKRREMLAREFADARINSTPPSKN